MPFHTSNACALHLSRPGESGAFRNKALQTTRSSRIPDSGHQFLLSFERARSAYTGATQCIDLFLFRPTASDDCASVVTATRQRMHSDCPDPLKSQSNSKRELIRPMGQLGQRSLCLDKQMHPIGFLLEWNGHTSCMQELNDHSTNTLVLLTLVRNRMRGLALSGKICARPRTENDVFESQEGCLFTERHHDPARERVLRF